MSICGVPLSWHMSTVTANGNKEYTTVSQLATVLEYDCRFCKQPLFFHGSPITSRATTRRKASQLRVQLLGAVSLLSCAAAAAVAASSVSPREVLVVSVVSPFDA